LDDERIKFSGVKLNKMFIVSYDFEDTRRRTKFSTFLKNTAAVCNIRCLS